MVRVTSVRIAQISTTVSNTKIHRIRAMLVTGLRNWSEMEGREMYVYRLCLARSMIYGTQTRPR